MAKQLSGTQTKLPIPILINVRLGTFGAMDGKLFSMRYGS